MHAAANARQAATHGEKFAGPAPGLPSGSGMYAQRSAGHEDIPEGSKDAEVYIRRLLQEYHYVMKSHQLLCSRFLLLLILLLLLLLLLLCRGRARSRDVLREPCRTAMGISDSSAWSIKELALIFLGVT
eukprot:2749317-Amphidinium_carterae.1